MKLNKTTKRRIVGLGGSMGLLGLFAVAMLCPIKIDSASADTGHEMNVAVNSASAISVALDDQVDVNVTPNSDGAFSSNKAVLSVATNNITGYSVYMGTKDGTQNLKLNGSTNPSDVIGPVSGTQAPASMAPDTWGYNIAAASDTTPGENLQYSAVPAVSAQIQTKDQTAMKDDYNLTFGAKVSTDLPAGQYTNTVVVSAVANPQVLTSLTQLTYMQDMTAAICSNTDEGVTKRLIDNRDGNFYYVAKMKDGRCWMNQNLALDLGGKTLTAADTDLANVNADGSAYTWGTGAPAGDGWTAKTVNNSNTEGENPNAYTYYYKGEEANPTETYYPMVNTSNAVPAAESSPSQVSTFSWNFGKWVLTEPTAGNNCGDVTSIAECTKVGFVDVSGSEWQPTHQYIQDGKVIDTTTNTYDPHYLIGNYYQYNTATAGTGGTIVDADATGSICPKGWQLPTSNTTDNGSFYALLAPYGIATGINSGTVESADGQYNIAKAPLYFVRSGEIHAIWGKIAFTAERGYLWSSTSAETLAFYFGVYNDYVSSSNGNDSRWIGFPLRCLARQ